MSIYIELLLLAAIVVYIVDLSGFKDTILSVASRFTARHGYPPVKSLRPFTCSLCSVWWTCLAWAAIRGQFSLPLVAYSAALSFFSLTLYELLIFTREGVLFLLRKMQQWLND